MIIHRLAAFSAIALAIAAGCESNNSTTRPSKIVSTSPSSDATAGSAEWWDQMTLPLHGQGSMSKTVYTVVIPRGDLWVQSEMGDVPTEAGISSKFYFYRCECGLMKVIGEFIVPDYECDDVIDALRGGQFTIASMAPILMHEKPILMSIRFQAEGHTDELIKVLRSALDWTGPMRSSTRPSD